MPSLTAIWLKSGGKSVWRREEGEGSRKEQSIMMEIYENITMSLITLHVNLKNLFKIFSVTPQKSWPELMLHPITTFACAVGASHGSGKVLQALLPLSLLPLLMSEAALSQLSLVWINGGKRAAGPILKPTRCLPALCHTLCSDSRHNYLTWWCVFGLCVFQRWVFSVLKFWRVITNN